MLGTQLSHTISRELLRTNRNIPNTIPTKGKLTSGKYYVFLTNSDFSPMAPIPSILQSIS